MIQKHWKSLISIKDITVHHVGDNPYEAKIEMQPLERGYGHTIGTALRRVLLSSMRGSAVTSFSIEGVSHEFSAVSFLCSDLTQIVLKMKQLRVSSVTDGPKTLTLNKTGRGLVYASDITPSADVQILNPDLCICEIARDDGVLNMEITVEQGSGYREAVHVKQREPNRIYVDALFSPVLNVAVHVEKTRVQQRTDYDKLELTILTDGTMYPRDALAYAARVLQEQLMPLVNFEDPEESAEADEDDETVPPVLLQKIVDLPITARSANCLRNENIVYVGDLVVLTESDMMRMPNFGRKSLEELRELLGRYDLRFGMQVPNWPPKKY